MAVFSPVKLTPAVHETIQSIGTIKYIAALDFEHHLFLGPWHKAFPQATVIAPEGLKEKRDSMPDIEKVRWDVMFRDDGSGSVREGAEVNEGYGVDEEFDREFDRAYVPGHVNKEMVFNFKRDRTLIQADLVWNLPAMEQYSKSNEDSHVGVLTKLFNKVQGTGGAQINWQKRFIWYVGSSRNRPGFGRSVSEIEAWDFDRIIPCHGDVVESDGKNLFRTLFGWHLKGKR